jgi:hypothetical protein
VRIEPHLTGPLSSTRTLGRLSQRALPSYRDGVDTDGLITPNFPHCLRPLEAVGSPAKPFWWCPRCRLATIA